MNKTELMQVHNALSMNRVIGRDANGNYTREATPKLITEAIALIDADLARVVEPVAQEDAIMKLADAYADACFDQGLNRVTVTQEPEDRRAELLAAVRALATPQAAAQPSQARELSGGPVTFGYIKYPCGCEASEGSPTYCHTHMVAMPVIREYAQFMYEAGYNNERPNGDFSVEAADYERRIAAINAKASA